MKYLRIKILGHETITAFENSEKENPKEPDFTAPGIGVWLNTSKKKSSRRKS